VDDPPEDLTAVSPSTNKSESEPGGPIAANGGNVVPAYQPPGNYVPPGVPPPRRKAWPWILGLLLLLIIVIGGMGVAAWFYFQPLKSLTANTNSSNTNANLNRNSNINSNSSNSNSNSGLGNQNLNDNSDASNSTPAPTNEAAVLADLTNLEHEWTVANINADKRKLDQILADDYVGTSGEGRPQAKAEYLRTVVPDNTIKKWDFENLKATLKGDRATLTGILRLKLEEQDVAYRFVDKFVWREGRWQATSSEVELLKDETSL
jgi:hypothetical protein